jgi:hypothetical protein
MIKWRTYKTKRLHTKRLSNRTNEEQNVSVYMVYGMIYGNPKKKKIRQFYCFFASFNISKNIWGLLPNVDC